MKQQTPEWFEARKGRVTGSVAGAIVGLSPYMKPKDVLRSMVRQYHGAESEFKGNVATEYGNQFEKAAQEDFELITGLEVKEVGFLQHPGYDWLGASPDGLIGDNDVLEIKCPYSKRNGGEFKSITEQPHYFAQTQLEMYCSGGNKCHFFQWSPHSYKLETIDLSRAWLDENIPKLKEFYDLYLSELDNDKHLSPLIQSKKADEAVNRYLEAKDSLEYAKEQLDQAKKELVYLAGGNKTNISGLLVYPIERKGSISYSKIVKEKLPELDLEQYRGKASESWGIR